MFALKKYWEFEAVLFVLLGAAAGFVVLTVHNSQTNYQASAQSLQNTLQPNFQTFPLNAITPTPIITTRPTLLLAKVAPTAKPTVAIAQTPAEQSSTSQISSDGTQSVNLAISQNQDGNQTYAISVNNGSTIFSKTLGAGNSISIPFNTWSPDNNYFFIQENDTNQTHVMVFNGSGQPFANGQAYLDLTGVFNNYGSSSAFDQASGWASENLIVILTKNSDGSEGTSYWFGVPDESITPLATMF